MAPPDRHYSRDYPLPQAQRLLIARESRVQGCFTVSSENVWKSPPLNV